MRIVLSADMEAISQMRETRQLLACCREYWDTGRQAMTDDVVAGVRGLLDAGADEVVVLDNHGSGNPENVIVSQLPAGSRAESWNVFDLPQKQVDGMFQLGYHPRADIDGFVPHTYVPGLRLWAGDEEISESHGRIWAARAPLLGIVGHSAHRATLGSLADVPFLTVQDGADRHQARPLLARDEALDQIGEFARGALMAIADAPRPQPPAATQLRARLRHGTESQAAVMDAAGWKRDRDEDFSIELASWGDARDPLAAAMTAGFEPFGELARLDVSSRDALDTQDGARLERLAERFDDSLQ